MAKIVLFGRVAGLLLLAAVSQASAQAPLPQTSSPQTSSERVAADPAGQYVLIKTVVAQGSNVAGRPSPMANPQGYDVLGYCWSPYHVLGDWAGRSGLTGRMIVLALETLSWARDLGRGGYPAAPLNAAIGNYEAAMIAAGLTDAARERAVDAFRSELETVARGAPGAVKTRKQGGCGGPGPAVQLRYQTVPKEGRAWFIAKPLHDICRAQQLDVEDNTRCDYWAAPTEAAPLAFVGDIAWLARWSDGTMAHGTFDSKTAGELGVVTLRQPVPRK